MVRTTFEPQEGIEASGGSQNKDAQRRPDTVRILGQWIRVFRIYRTSVVQSDANQAVMCTLKFPDTHGLVQEIKDSGLAA